jgi:hypothetical protein
VNWAARLPDAGTTPDAGIHRAIVEFDIVAKVGDQELKDALRDLLRNLKEPTTITGTTSLPFKSVTVQFHSSKSPWEGRDFMIYHDEATSTGD